MATLKKARGRALPRQTRTSQRARLSKNTGIDTKLSGPTKATTDHDKIREWVEERGGTPSHVKGTGRKGDLGMLRIDFPGFSGARTLEAVEWEDWLEAFDANNLAFIYEDRMADGRPSRFNKLVSRDTVRRRQSGERGASVHKGGRVQAKAKAKPRRGVAQSRARVGRATKSRKSTSRARSSAR